jgi:hypothetical protein
MNISPGMALFGPSTTFPDFWKLRITSLAVTSRKRTSAGLAHSTPCTGRKFRRDDRCRASPLWIMAIRFVVCRFHDSICFRHRHLSSHLQSLWTVQSECHQESEIILIPDRPRKGHKSTYQIMINSVQNLSCDSKDYQKWPGASLDDSPSEKSPNLIVARKIETSDRNFGTIFFCGFALSWILHDAQ